MASGEELPALCGSQAVSSAPASSIAKTCLRICQQMALTQHPAAPAVDIPAVESRDAEFDVAANAGKAHRPFDKIPHVAIVAVRQCDLPLTVQAFDGAVLLLRKMAHFTHRMEVRDRHLRKM